MEKDYSLLRPFDLEAAKRGEKVCWSNLPDEVDYIGVTRNGDIAYESGNELDFCSSRFFRMSPLAWVEGRPVYSGDVLYKKAETWGKFVKVTGAKPDGEFLILECDEPHYSGTEYADNRRGWLSWQKPKTKREGWCLILDGGTRDRVVRGPFSSEQIAKDSRCIGERLIDCIKITWEE